MKNKINQLGYFDIRHFDVEFIANNAYMLTLLREDKLGHPHS